jgi:hypothetical protein
VDGEWGIGEWGVEEVPGFAVFFQAHAFGLAVGVETEHGLRSADFDGDDVPDVEGDDVGGDEVDVALGVDGAAFADGVGGAGFVGVGAEAVGTFDLHAEEFHARLRAVVEDEVVALAVSPGLADGEAALAGLVKESGFGTFSGTLGVGTVGVVGLAGVHASHGKLLGARKGGACGLRLILRNVVYIFKIYYNSRVKLKVWRRGQQVPHRAFRPGSE